MLKKLTFIIFLIAAIPVLVLSFKNSTVVDIDYIFGNASLPIPWLISGSFAMGALVMIPFFALTGMMWKSKAKRLEKSLNEVHKDKDKEKITEEFKAEQAV